MKGSRIVLWLAILFAIAPAIAVKFSLWIKYKNQAWTFHSSKVKLDMADVDTINMNGLKTFRYQYHPDSAYLEYNSLYEDNYFKVKNNRKLSISVKDSPVQNFTYPPPVLSVFSLFSNPNPYLQYHVDRFKSGTNDIVFHGPLCPPIRASNTVFYIESVAPNASFNFDLNFSIFYWENYKKWPNGKFDKKLTTPWYMNELKLKLNQSTYYLTKDLHFNKVNIKAIKKTDLDFDANYYKEANIEVDSTVIVRAPVSIWNKLKLTLNNE